MNGGNLPTYSKNLIWLEPFVNAVKHKIPLEKLKSIKGYRIPMSKEERSSGMCTALRGFYSITLLTHVQDRDTKTSKKFYRTKTIEDLLATLAHELTHLVEWEHTAEFAKLYGYILEELEFLIFKRG